MENRPKMPRSERAKQFMPFDALKGLKSAMRIKEYENERIAKGEMSEEKAKELSKLLISLDKDETIKLIYYDDGHNVELVGKALVDSVKRIVKVQNQIVQFDQIVDIIVQSIDEC